MQQVIPDSLQHMDLSNVVKEELRKIMPEPTDMLISSTLMPKRSFIVKCSLCHKEMEFVEGDTIYGDRWYHNLCWKDSMSNK